MTVLTEGAELVGESGNTYLAVRPLGQDNVYIAVEKDNHGTIVILKSPATDDHAPWPCFAHEMVMHELFKTCPSIRKQIDRVPPSEQHPPILALEILETTLWQARSKRPFTTPEIISVAKSLLHGLHSIHAQGLVYADLKMENIMLNGFEVNTPGNGKGLVTKLADLGNVMPPTNGKTQPIVYRAPEIYFKGEISPATDIWAFGLVCCHLLEAQHCFSAAGLYDDLHTTQGTVSEREQAVRYEIADDYNIGDVEYYQGCNLPYQHRDRSAGQQWQRLRERGLSEDEIDFLRWVLRVDPRDRPTASEILGSRWLSSEVDTDENRAAFPGQRTYPAAMDGQNLPQKRLHEAGREFRTLAPQQLGGTYLSYQSLNAREE